MLLCVSPALNPLSSHVTFTAIVPETTPASQALQLSIEAHTGTPPAADWKRPPGRPRKTWLQQVEEDCCWCCPDCKPGSFDVEDATILSWSSAAVSE